MAADPKRLLGMLPPMLLAVGITMLILGIERTGAQFKASFLLLAGGALAAAGIGAGLVLPQPVQPAPKQSKEPEPEEGSQKTAKADGTSGTLSKKDREMLSRVASEEKELEERVGALAKELARTRDAVKDAGEGSSTDHKEAGQHIAELEERMVMVEEAIMELREGARPSSGPSPPGPAPGGPRGIVEHISPVGTTARGPIPPPPPPGGPEEEYPPEPEGFPCTACGFANQRRTAFCGRCGARM